MHRALPKRRADLAEAAGKFTGSLMRTVPGVFGALSVCAGTWMIYRPAALILAGAFLLVLDRRTL